VVEEALNGRGGFLEWAQMCHWDPRGCTPAKFELSDVEAQGFTGAISFLVHSEPGLQCRSAVGFEWAHNMWYSPSMTVLASDPSYHHLDLPLRTGSVVVDRNGIV